MRGAQQMAYQRIPYPPGEMLSSRRSTQWEYLVFEYEQPRAVTMHPSSVQCFPLEVAQLPVGEQRAGPWIQRDEWGGAYGDSPTSRSKEDSADFDLDSACAEQEKASELAQKILQGCWLAPRSEFPPDLTSAGLWQDSADLAHLERLDNHFGQSVGLDHRNIPMVVTEILDQSLTEPEEAWAEPSIPPVRSKRPPHRHSDLTWYCYDGVADQPDLRDK
eukprot:TRINITY_DN8170_c0_g2_i2.p1 TRINITY_DN8170_c0_g2~~TRINITY_DN8170_c0_g2_i2.p1  ORF type:complete len:218 (+),score=8.30 TRINITY_DN8170_c0_g2_i2:206-859(+)